MELGKDGVLWATVTREGARGQGGSLPGLPEGELPRGSPRPPAAQGHGKGNPRGLATLGVWSGPILYTLYGPIIPRALGGGGQLIINCLLRVAFQILALESSGRRAEPAYPVAMAGRPAFLQRVGQIPLMPGPWSWRWPRSRDS